MVPRRPAMKQGETFKDLPPLMRGALVFGAVADVALRIYATIDVVKRPEEEIHGPKAVWLPALGAVSSFGLLPLIYLKLGRRR